jgi:hypothetical protein
MYTFGVLNPFVIPIQSKAVSYSKYRSKLHVKAIKLAFSLKRVVADNGPLQISTGSLLLAFNLNAVWSSDQIKVILVRWKNQIVDSENSNYRLMFVLYNTNKLLVPIETGFIRKDEMA